VSGLWWSPRARDDGLVGVDSSLSGMAFLPHREEALTAEIAGATAAAAKAAPSKGAAAAAAAAAFDDNGDLVQQLGWAHVDALSLDDFVAELASAPASSAAALEVRSCCVTDDVCGQASERVPKTGRAWNAPWRSLPTM